MIFARTALASGLLATALAGAACAGRRAAAGDGARIPPDSAAALEAVFRARQDSARTRFTAADVRFVSGMIPHHAQAIVMARLAPTHAAGPAVQTLAARIINAQQDEIALMERWLRERDQPVPDAEAHAHAGHAAPALGMLTPEQLAELDRARGPEFDRLFLTYMIQHHRGAVAMVRELFATDGAAQDAAIFKFASDVRVDQATEIARMERMLAAMSDEPTVR